MNIPSPAFLTKVRFAQAPYSQQHLEAIEKEIVAALKNQGLQAYGFFYRQRNIPLVFHVDAGQESQAQSILANLPDSTPKTSNDHHLRYKNIPICIDPPLQ